MQMAGTISVLGQNFTAMDNTKSSEPMKEKVKWLTPGKICEQTVCSNSDSTGNDIMTVDEAKGHEEAGTEPLLKEGWASSQSCYMECS
jgi:archaellum component FlaG (FlaF/FlaG flagellin family)